jgi:hypothetical protein
MSWRWLGVVRENCGASYYHLSRDRLPVFPGNLGYAEDIKIHFEQSTMLRKNAGNGVTVPVLNLLNS